MTAFIYDLITILPVSFVATLLAKGYIAQGVEDMPLYTVTLILTALCILFYHLKARGRILFSGIAAAVVLGMIFARRTETFGKLLWILPVFVVCAISFLIGKAANGYIRFKAVLAAVFFAGLIIMMVFKSHDIKGTVVAALFYILLFAAEAVQTFWKKEGDPGLRAHVSFMLPFILAVIIPLSLIKAPDRPYDWRFFKDLAKSIRTGCGILIQSLSPEGGWDGGDTMGFSDRGAIGGSVSGDPYTVLAISSDTENDYRLYLSGKTFDTFDGRNWEKTDESDIDEKSYDLIETIAAVRKYDSENTADFLKNVMLHVSYEGIRTKHLFVPAKAVPEISQMPFTQKGGDMVISSKRKSDYLIKYYRINKDDPEFQSLLESGMEVSEEDRQQAVSDYLPSKQDMYSAAGYSQYKKLVNDFYLQPVKLSDRTKEFMDEYLADAESDAEKLRRIEKLLSSFNYTRIPGEIPENISSPEEFLDWFLFEKKEGFCTHFATSFVLLARAYDIPARYVQGYSTLSKKLKFDIGSDRSHAWPEAYVKGVGWIGYEPTPGYRQTSGWDRSQGQESTENAGDSIHSTYEGNRPEAGTDDIEDVEKESGIRDVLTVLGSRFVKIMIIVIAVFLVLFFVFDRALRIYRYRHMSDEDKLFELCRRNMKLLKRIGYGIGPGETLGEFRVRLEKEIPEDLAGFTETYENILYREGEDRSESVPALEECNRKLRRYVFDVFLQRFGLVKKNIKKNEI